MKKTRQAYVPPPKGPKPDVCVSRVVALWRYVKPHPKGRLGSRHLVQTAGCYYVLVEVRPRGGIDWYVLRAVV